jgi:hypothetical protein
MFFRDALPPRLERERRELVETINRLRAQHWADPGDRELREQLEQLQAELRALDGGQA